MEKTQKYCLRSVTKVSSTKLSNWHFPCYMVGRHVIQLIIALVFFGVADNPNQRTWRNFREINITLRSPCPRCCHISSSLFFVGGFNWKLPIIVMTTNHSSCIRYFQKAKQPISLRILQNLRSLQSLNGRPDGPPFIQRSDTALLS